MTLLTSELRGLAFEHRLKVYDEIFIPHPKVDLVQRKLAALMSQTEAAIARNRARDKASDGQATKRDELWLLPIIGPSGSTKSKTLQIVTERLRRDRPSRAQIPVLVVTVKSSTSDMPTLQAAILEAFRDKSARVLLRKNDYSELNVNNGIMRIARRKGTTVIVFDEAHNMLVEGSPEVMSQALKSLVNDGVFSIVIAGTDATRPLFRNTEFLGRCKVPLLFGPPTRAKPESCLALFRFTEKLCKEMHRQGVVDRPLLLTDSIEHSALLYDMTEGNLGRVCRLIRLGLEEAFDQGIPWLDWQTLCEAFSAWISLSDEGAYDPIASGTRLNTLESIRVLVEQPK